MRRIRWTILAIAVLATSTPAVPPNDECDGAIPITGFGMFSFDSTGATSSEGRPDYDCTNDFLEPDEFAADVWFEWTPSPTTLENSIVVSTCGLTTFDTRIAFYLTKCPEDVSDPEACDDDGCGLQSRLEWRFLESQPYLIRIGTRAGLQGGPGYFRLLPGELIEPGTGPFFNCPSSSQESTGASFEICNARDRFDAINSTRGQFLVADDFVPESDGILRGGCWWGTYLRDSVECRRGLVDFFEITYYADDCGAPGEIVAGPFSQEDVTMEVVGPVESNAAYPNLILEYQFSSWHNPVPVQQGRRYWIGITNSLYDNCAWYWGTGSGHAGYAVQMDDRDDTTTTIPTDLAFCFHIVENDGPVCETNPPANDDCAAAIPLTSDGADFDTYGATTDGPVNQPSYNPYLPSACDLPLGDEQVHRDIWYTFDAQCASTVRLSTCDGNFDTKLAVYEDMTCPPSAPAIACNDDACGDDLARQSQLEFQTNADQSYLVRLGGYFGTVGQGILTFELKPPARTSLRDFALFTRCFDGATELCCPLQDFNADGEVDIDDLPGFRQTFVGP